MRRSKSCALLIAAALLSGCAAAPPRAPAEASLDVGPSPAGTRLGLPNRLKIPPDSEILDGLSAALDLRRRDDFDRALDAKDPGELLEHATLTQVAIDRGIFGPDALFVVGDELFDYEFRPEQGLGNALAGAPGVRAGARRSPNLRRVHEGEFGGPDSQNCSSCHFKGGPDGAGNNTQNAFLRSDGRSTLAADERNPPHLLGLGPVQALALEMTAELQAQRREAIEAAARQNGPVRAALESKGVSFGSLTAFPDGRVDESGIDGVDGDLAIKPFGWKGHQATIRAMVEESFRIHQGIVSMRDQARVRDGAADGADFGDGAWYDVDRDGVTIEIDGGMVTTMVAYLAQLEAPVIRPPQPEALLDAFGRGERLFDEAGCSSCHHPALELKDPNLAVGLLKPGSPEEKPIVVNVARDGDHPKIEPLNVLETGFKVRLFSDLKRHDMGPELAAPRPQGGIPASVFLTRPLWGLAFTAPYLHDGRAPTVDDAIRLHGGEAAASRDRYLTLSEDERASLRVFLLSLTRQPKLFVP
jgi:mono/diheme cytochrome c family protein